MKKILLLGGSDQQVIAIENAKKLGYFTILCDYLDDNPGQYVADKFYLISTTDKKAVLKIAKKERIDGILAYASDPAAPTAAYVAEILKLPTNPYKSVDILCNKDKFRRFLSENGFNTPIAESYSKKESIIKDRDKFNLPVIIKPVDSSGSKGTTVIHSWEDFEAAFIFALDYSKTKKVIVEEFIEKKHQYLIGGDIFVQEGNITVWGLMNCHRDYNVNPLVPVGKSFPLLLSERDIQLVHKTMQELISKLNISFGSVNVEIVIDKNDKVWLIDIGPRAGGNMIPDLLGKIFNINLVKMAILTAMGERITCNEINGFGYYASHVLHSSKSGKLSEIKFSDEIETKIIEKTIYKKTGDSVEFFDNASKALGIILMKFVSERDMFEHLVNINNHYSVIIEDL